MLIIEQIVNRQHVGATPRQVIRAIHDALRPGGTDRITRRQFYRHALKHHARNRELYIRVNGGYLS